MSCFLKYLMAWKMFPDRSKWARVMFACFKLLNDIWRRRRRRRRRGEASTVCFVPVGWTCPWCLIGSCLCTRRCWLGVPSARDTLIALRSRRPCGWIRVRLRFRARLWSGNWKVISWPFRQHKSEYLTQDINENVSGVSSADTVVGRTAVVAGGMTISMEYFENVSCHISLSVWHQIVLWKQKARDFLLVLNHARAQKMDNTGEIFLPFSTSRFSARDYPSLGIPTLWEILLRRPIARRPEIWNRFSVEPKPPTCEQFPVAPRFQSDMHSRQRLWPERHATPNCSRWGILRMPRWLRVIHGRVSNVCEDSLSLSRFQLSALHCLASTLTRTRYFSL